MGKTSRCELKTGKHLSSTRLELHAVDEKKNSSFLSSRNLSHNNVSLIQALDLSDLRHLKAL